MARAVTADCSTYFHVTHSSMHIKDCSLCSGKNPVSMNGNVACGEFCWTESTISLLDKER